MASKTRKGSLKKSSARKLSAKKKPPAKRARKKKSTASRKAAPRGSAARPLVTAQPESKQKAAVQAGMFLYTDDAWSLAYFNSADLHCVERKLFG